MQGKRETRKSFDWFIWVFCLMVMLGVHFQASAQLNGTYTIGGTSPNYASFTAAVSALSAGVSGPVVFNVRNGTYTENLTISGAISGASATNTITFQAESGNAANVTLQSTAFDHIIEITTTKYLIFKNLSVSYNGSSSSYNVFRINDDVDDLTISGCILTGTNSTGSSNTNAVIYSNETSTANIVDNLTIENNSFNRTGNAIYFNSGSAKANGLVITGNTFNNQFTRGMYINNANEPIINGNTFTTSNAGYIGIDVFSSISPEMVGNTMPLTTGKYGIAISGSSGTSGKYGLIANNMISLSGTASQAAGIALQSSTSYTNIYFNSVRMATTSNTSLTACLLLSSSIVDGTINIVNNNFVQAGGLSSQTCMYFNGAVLADVNAWDYNNYYHTGSSYLAYISGSRANLAVLKSYSGKDASSISIDPLFTSTTDLHTTETALQAGTAITGITTDIDGDFRQTPPYIGADEIAAPAVGDDAGITAMVLPTLPPCSGSVPFEVEVTNYGTNTLTSVTVNWSINAVPQTPYTATGLNVATTGTTTISLGNATLVSNTPYTFEFSTSDPNGVTDANSTNDTYSPPVTSTSLSGTYTIGGSSPDFADFTDAVDALHTYGVCGPVVFNVRQGTYTEQIQIGGINNASSTNTVTFQADPANSSAAILEYNSQAFATNYVLNLHGASYLRFINLTIKTTNTSTYRRVLYFSTSNSDIRFEDNIIEAPVANSNSTYYTVVYMDNTSSTFDNDIVFDGNQILNGSNGIYMQAPTSNYETGNQIINNTITGYYFKGIFASYQDGIIVQNNEVRGSGPNLTAADFADFIGYVAITGNIFEAAGSSSSGTNIAMEMLDCDGISGNPSLVANNFFIATAPAGTVEGIRFGSSTIHYDFTANNIYVSSTNATSTSGVYFNSADEIGFYSNNVFCDGPGNCIEYLTTSNNLYSDHNNLAVANGGIIGYYSGNQTSLADWQSATTLDANSVSIDPQYVSLSSPFDLHINEASLAGEGLAFGGITVDIDGDARPVPPTIGADEATPPAGCVTPIADNTITGGGLFCDEIPAGTMEGTTPTGGDGTYTYQWQVSTDGVGFADVPSLGNGEDYDHPQSSVAVWYRRLVASGLCADTSNTEHLEIKSGFIWTGDVSSNWHVPANWDCGDVPNATTDVFIPAIATNQPEILPDSTGECRTIILEPGTELLINEEAILNVFD